MGVPEVCEEDTRTPIVVTEQAQSCRTRERDKAGALAAGYLQMDTRTASLGIQGSEWSHPACTHNLIPHQLELRAA